MPETYINPSRAQLEALQKLNLDGPLVMVNLLKFNPDGGAEAYARYGEQAAPFLAKVGAKVRYLGRVAATVIGGEEWDEVILVEYPSKAAFFEMTGNPDYPGGVRADALIDSRLYCSQEVPR